MTEWNENDTDTILTSRNRRDDTVQGSLFLAVGCFLMAVFLWFGQGRREQWQLAERIAPGILRLHVIADSNSEEDQKIKLRVKSFLIEKIYEELDGADSCTKGEVVGFLCRNRLRLEDEMERFIRRSGGDDSVSLNVVWCEFPEKYYGDITLPAGIYEAAQVRIGKGQGHNWWCVLYPRVCITKDAVAVVPESSQEELERVLSEEDYLAIQSKRPVIHFDFQLRRQLARLFSVP